MIALWLALQAAPIASRPVQDMDQIKSGTEGQDNAVGSLIANDRCEDARRLAAFYARKHLIKSVERACGPDPKR